MNRIGIVSAILALNEFHNENIYMVIWQIDEKVENSEDNKLIRQKLRESELILLMCRLHCTNIDEMLCKKAELKCSITEQYGRQWINVDSFEKDLRESQLSNFQAIPYTLKNSVVDFASITMDFIENLEEKKMNYEKEQKLKILNDFKTYQSKYQSKVIKQSVKDSSTCVVNTLDEIESAIISMIDSYDGIITEYEKPIYKCFDTGRTKDGEFSWACRLDRLGKIHIELRKHKVI